MMFIKLSIGVFLLRLASQRRYKWIIWISMGIVATMSSALFLWDIFQCKPVAAQWDYTIPGYTCVSPEQVVQAAYALSALSILSDWLYALLPIPMLWTAKMTPQAKATVSVVLGLGILLVSLDPTLIWIPQANSRLTQCFRGHTHQTKMSGRPHRRRRHPL